MWFVHSYNNNVAKNCVNTCTNYQSMLKSEKGGNPSEVMETTEIYWNYRLNLSESVHKIIR
jgi:hypothetical protein